MTPTVRFQPTPNPNAGKFVVDRPVVDDDRPRSYRTPAEAGDEPVARALLELNEVVDVFMVEDFITVTKTPASTWDGLIPRVVRAIEDRLAR